MPHVSCGLYLYGKYNVNILFYHVWRVRCVVLVKAFTVTSTLTCSHWGPCGLQREICSSFCSTASGCKITVEERHYQSCVVSIALMLESLGTNQRLGIWPWKGGWSVGWMTRTQRAFPVFSKGVSSASTWSTPWREEKASIPLETWEYW